MNYGQEYRIDSDVAIIGGGTAGLNAAMAVAQKGLSVLVAEKANIYRSGAMGGGIDHFMAYLETGEGWDTRETYLKYVGRVAHGAANLQIHEHVFCEELRDTIERIERIGVSLRNTSTGDFYRTQAMGQPGPYFINFNGKLLKPKMAEEVHRLGCQVLDRLQVTNLLLHDSEMAGFTGFNIRTGDFYVVRAKAIIISTGNTNRMFKTQTGNPFNLWYCPACTGDLHRQAFDAGASMANMEYVRMSIVPKGFSAPGFNAFFGMGGKLINSLGDAFMKNYHSMADRAPRNYVVWGAIQELKEGRGPIYMDCRHLDQKELEHLFSTLGYDKDTLPDFLMKKGYHLSGGLIEMNVSEPMQARPSELCGSGIKIDRNCSSNIPGLFAAGDSADQMGCLHMCTAGGFAAGKHAADYAARINQFKHLDEESIAREKERVFRPLQIKKGTPYWEFEDIVRQITTDHFGPVKTENSLNSALDKLYRLDNDKHYLKAENLHNLMRVHEAMNIQDVAKITANAALARKESRFHPYHYRADYPETDNENFCGLIVVKKRSDGKPETTFEQLYYES